MHVAIVAPYDPRPPPGSVDPKALHGGVEAALAQMAKGLAARGHDVTVVTSAATSGRSDEPDGFRILRVRRRGTLYRTPLAPLHRAIPRDAHVVHVPATYPFHSDLIPLRERRRGRACVLDHHFDAQGTTPAMRAAVAAHRATLARGMHAAARILVKSRDHAAASPVAARFDPAKVDLVPNGVDVAEFRADAPRGEAVLCVGRLVPYKGVENLVRAMPRVFARTGARALVAGDGPERARLEALASSLSAPVTFLGRLPRADLVDALARARVLALPSANGQEAFGIALLEALASGTPVVASDLPGVREVATLGGRTVPPGDPEALAEAIVETWRDPDRYGSPTTLRARVAERFGWPVVLDALEASYAKAREARA